MAPSRPASLRANSKLVRSLSGKFLLVFIPVFLLISVLGILLLARYDKREDRDSLATRIGSQAARVIASIERHGANDNPGLAQDFVAALASDHAVTCVEYRDGRLLAAVPPRIGCSTVANGYRLALPVGEDGAGSLLVIFSDAEIASAVEVRRNLVLLLIAIAFLVSTFSALTGFRLIVGRPLQRLHASIKHLSETGERQPVNAPAGDRLGEIIEAFNAMLEREAQKERRIDQANREILALNRTLEARVAERTEQLHESERRLRELVDQFGSGIYIHAKFKPIYANKTLLDMFGYDGQEDFLAIGSTENLLAPEERPRVWGYHQARLRGEPAPTDYDLIALKKSGERFPVNNRSFVVKWDGQDAVCTTLFDLTQRRDTEKSLIEQQHLMNSLLERTHEGFWFIDLQGRTTDVNPAMCAILSRSPDEIIGRKIFDFVDAENEKIFHDQIAKRKRGVAGAYEIALRRPDGTNVPCLNNATPLFTSEGERIGSVGIWADITEIKEFQSNLERETERAQAANVAKSEFLAIASHELRTPMNGVLGMAGLLLKSDLTAEQRHRVDVIKQSGESLLELLNDILDISKIESGRFEIETCTFDLRRMIDSVSALLQSRAEQKGLSYRVDVDADVPEAFVGDLARLRQILFNIVGNAVKFTDEGSVRIRVSHEAVDRKSTRLRISVTDTGPGIAGHVRDHIFEKFTQADVSTTRKFGGTGLGLAICKDLVAMMGGEIGVESVPGEGSEFWFTALCEIGARADAVDDPPFRPATLHFDDEERRSLRVLVAEDNPVNQEIAKDTLELAGHRVDVVVNGIEAVEAVRKAFYDVVLMDAHMPEMDGPTATRKIRTLPGEVSKVPIIALTADAMVGDREKFLAAGMNDYVSKPFQPDVLFATIERWLRPNLADPSSVEPETQASAVSEGPAFGLDAAVVDPLRLGKPDLWKRLVEIFTANTPASIDKLTQALADEDRAAVHMVAHALKSSSANMGAARLSDLCRQLETASATAIPASGKGLLAEIRAEFDTVSAELESAHEPVTEGATA